MTDTSTPQSPRDHEASWPKPGPGTWDLDSSHCGPAPSPILRELYEDCLPRGMADGFALFGAPLKGMDMKWVNGKFYRRLVPLVGSTRDMPPPPAPLLWLATRIHPAFRAQERRAAESFRVKRWRSELARWENEWKPDLTKANLAFADTDTAALSDADLADHLAAIDAHLRETVALHFRLHVSDMGPLGNLMIHLEDWGLDRASTFRALVAASPATRGPARQLQAIADAVRSAGVDPSTLTTLDDIRAASPEAASALADYLRFNGWRLTTYEIEGSALVEMPHLVVASVRAAAAKAAAGDGEDTGDSGDSADRAIAALRDEVPPEHRATFDDLVEDARLSYGLRDENGPITYEWPAGLLRRGLLEAGRRLAAAGRVASAAQVFELRIPEITTLLRDGTGPGPDEIAARAAKRTWEAALVAPERLGRDEGPPPVDAMPENLARITRIVLTVVSALEGDPQAAALSGLGIGTEPYVGTARVVHDAADAFEAIEPGDVIVAPYTAPTYNAVLAVAGAVVTEEGGLLSHAAVLARELGLPAVIGAAGAMTRIPDGATIEVDPVAGRVRILDS